MSFKLSFPSCLYANEFSRTALVPHNQSQSNPLHIGIYIVGRSPPWWQHTATGLIQNPDTCQPELKMLHSTIKSKVHHTPLRERRRVLISLSRPWARRWRTINVCDAWPVRRQTYSYLPSRKASLPIGWYQIILLGDRGIFVLTTCPGLHSTAGRPGFEPATCWSQVQRPNHSATEPHHRQL